MKYWQKQQISKVLYQSCGHIQFCWCRKPWEGSHPVPKPNWLNTSCPSAGMVEWWTPRAGGMSSDGVQALLRDHLGLEPRAQAQTACPPSQHPQHLFSHLAGHLLDACWFARKAGQALGNEFKMITCCILSLLFLFNLSAHNSLPMLLLYLCGIVNTQSYSEH